MTQRVNRRPSYHWVRRLRRIDVPLISRSVLTTSSMSLSAGASNRPAGLCE